MSESEIAAFLGIGTSRVRTLGREGVMVRVGRGRLDVQETLGNHLARLRDGSVKAGPVTDEMKAEKLRLAKQQADKIEIQNAAARRELVRSADVEREWANVLRDVRSTVLAVPSRVGSKLAHLTAHDVAEIDREIKSALEGLANGN
jgi:phage terminase Nu1 subunit (DNA packaging protein)